MCSAKSTHDTLWPERGLTLCAPSYVSYKGSKVLDATRLPCFLDEISAGLITCVDDGGPRLDIDAGSSLPGPEDPHERLGGEDAGCFAHL